jgi:hypothetical protein
MATPPPYQRLDSTELDRTLRVWWSATASLCHLKPSRQDATATHCTALKTGYSNACSRRAVADATLRVEARKREHATDTDERRGRPRLRLEAVHR